jgi:hypothetical protein
MGQLRKRGKVATDAELEAARIAAMESWGSVLKLSAGGGLTAAVAADAKQALDTYQRLLLTQPARKRNGPFKLTTKRKKTR